MKTTIDMAKEAGLLTWLKPPKNVIERFKAFEALVRADEREACAKAVEAEAHMFETLAAAKSLAAAIRNRGNT
jgi:hypothetical protein